MRYLKKIILIFTLLFSGLISSQSSPFLIGFPAPPEDITVCEDASKLTIRIASITNVTSVDSEIEILLGDGVEYVPGSLTTLTTLTSTPASFTIVDNGGTPNAPKFKLTSSTNFSGNYIEFEIQRKADCNARTSVLTGTIFNDTVNATLNSDSVTEDSPSYNILFAALSFTQPTAISGVVPGNTYTRNFTINNVSQGCTSAVYFSIEYPNGEVTQTSLTLNGNSVVESKPPSGNIHYYTITGAALTSDANFCNGEALVFTEVIEINSCNFTDTEYKLGWGCDADPASWCQTSDDVGSIIKANGLPNYTSHSIERIGFVDACTSMVMRSTYTNGGTGNPVAAAMYNIILRKGQYITYELAYPTNIVKIDNGSIRNVAAGTNSAPLVGTYNGYYDTDLTDLFTTDPDGVGVGLEDMDGDGFFDDLPAGNSVVLDVDFTIECGTDKSCGNNFQISTAYSAGRIFYTTMCGPSTITAPSSIRASQAGLFSYQLLAWDGNGYAPANISDGVPFNVRTSVAYFINGNAFRTADSRYEYRFTLPPGLTIAGNVQWYAGEFPNTAVPSPHTFTQTGNNVVIQSPTPGIGYATFDLVYDCAAGGNVTDLALDYELWDIETVTGCECLGFRACKTLSMTAICPGNCTEGGPSTTSTVVRRSDNSLGWTDVTMATRQTASNISDYQLSRALFLDEIEVTSTGVQNIPAGSTGWDDLFIRIQLNKAGATDKLTSLTADATITRGATVVSVTDLTTFSLANSTATEQFVDWDLTSLVAMLPGGELLDGDIIDVTSRYSVATNSLPTNDVQSGNTYFLWNTDPVTGVLRTCNELVPEMYLVGTSYVDGRSAATASGCNVGGFFANLARRFNSAGFNFSDEYRPGFKITTLTIDVGKSLDLVDATLIHNTGVSFKRCFKHFKIKKRDGKIKIRKF